MNLFEKHKNCTGLSIGLHLFADDVAELVMPSKDILSFDVNIAWFIDDLIYTIIKGSINIFNNLDTCKHYENEDFSRIKKIYKKGFFSVCHAPRGILSNVIIYCIAYSVKNNNNNDINMFKHEIVRMSFVLYEKLHNRYSELVKEI